ncbi:unnamed protein product, partial [Brassica oleracea]
SPRALQPEVKEFHILSSAKDGRDLKMVRRLQRGIHGASSVRSKNGRSVQKSPGGKDRGDQNCCLNNQTRFINTCLQLLQQAARGRTDIKHRS